MTSATPSNRDFSELSALLAKAAAAPAKPATKTPSVRKQVPANDNKVADVLAWPTLERLAHRQDEARVYALRHWRNMRYPGSEFVPTVDEDETEELEMEIRPSEAELLGAMLLQRHPHLERAEAARGLEAELVQPLARGQAAGSGF